jgi:hypothetical protein
MCAGQPDVGEEVIVERPQLADAAATPALEPDPADQSVDRPRDLPRPG